MPGQKEVLAPNQGTAEERSDTAAVSFKICTDSGRRVLYVYIREDTPAMRITALEEVGKQIKEIEDIISLIFMTGDDIRFVTVDNISQ